MGALKSIQILAMAVFSLTACDDEPQLYCEPVPHFKETMRSGYKSCTEQAVFQNEKFVFPDSINPSLIVVTFYEDCPQQGNSVIVYTDSSRKNAVKIKYFKDRRVLTDKLVAISFNYFRSIDGRGEYIVTQQKVMFSHTSGSLSFGIEHQRTDMELASLWQLPLPVVVQAEIK